jgi:tetratricopeptide (TPR) repeat protein
MYKRIAIVSTIIFLIIAGNIFADKPLERVANELAVEGETLFNSGDYSSAAGKFKEAVSSFKQAIEQDGIPTDNEKIDKWLFNAYQSYLQGSNFNNAIEIQKERKQLKPNDWKLIKEMAVIYAKYLDNVDAGISELTAFDKNNNSFAAKKLAGSYYNKYKKDKENSLIWYKKAFEQKQDSKVLQNIASLHKDLGNNSEAIKAYENYIKTNPNESKLILTYKNLANLYEELGNNLQAIKFLGKANELKSDDPLLTKLIVLYFDGDDYENAVKKINDLLYLDNSNETAIFYRARINFNKNEKVLAKTDFEKLLNSSVYGRDSSKFIESIESE